MPLYDIKKAWSKRGQLTANKLTTNQRFRHIDLVNDFVTVILSLSEGLGKMALGIVKYAYDCSFQLIGVIWFVVSLFAVRCRGPAWRILSIALKAS